MKEKITDLNRGLRHNVYKYDCSKEALLPEHHICSTGISSLPVSNMYGPQESKLFGHFIYSFGMSCSFLFCS